MSNKIFVISDPHFGHKNMALSRGFSSVEAHDRFIIDEWNKVVTKKDTVILLGDCSMERHAYYEIFNELKGIKKVIMGNHDLGKHSRKLLEYVNSIQSYMEIGGCILSHIPVHPSELKRFRKNIHGHTHSKHVTKFFGLLKDKRYVNVCCEIVDYVPVELKTLLYS